MKVCTEQIHTGMKKPLTCGFNEFYMYYEEGTTIFDESD